MSMSRLMSIWTRFRRSPSTSPCASMIWRLRIADCGFKDSSLIKSAIHNPNSAIKLPLALLVLGVRADHAHNALAVDDLAVVAHLLYRSSDFHFALNTSVNRPAGPHL